MCFYLKSIKIFPNCRMTKILKPGFYPLVDANSQLIYNQNVMVSAIVGQNGCGKSALLEIIFRLINNLSVFITCNSSRNAAEELYFIEGIYADLQYELNGNIGVLKCRDKSVALEYGQHKYKFGNPFDEFNESYELCKDIDDSKRIEIMKCFFYSIVANYSIQAYNAYDYRKDPTKIVNLNGEIENKKGGIWINSLFHKNDGYMSAININPYRTNGIFNMNKESRLSKERMSVILLWLKNDSTNHQADGNQFISGYELKDIKYWLDTELLRNKINVALYSENESKYEEFDDIISRFTTQLKSEKTIASIILGEFGIDIYDISSPLKIYAYLYIVYKVLSIASKYPAYKNYSGIGHVKYAFMAGSQNQRIDTIHLAKKVHTDHSHITKKIWQTIKNIKKLNSGDNCEFIYNSTEVIPFSYYEYDKIQVDDIGVFDLPLELLSSSMPPPFFDYSIILHNVETNADMDIEMLSSGERQFYYAVSTLIYHTLNIKSVPTDRVNYQNIAFILDEIELSFHPEYQRRFIYDITSLISRLQLNKFIHFHIFLTTHSPFILSDIVRSNILYLDKGDQCNNDDFINPFGANINDILSQSFFLRNGFTGEYARNKILSLANYLSSNDGQNDDWNNQKVDFLLRNISEPILHQCIIGLYREKFGDFEPDPLSELGYDNN